jgi:hypothetical protein
MVKVIFTVASCDVPYEDGRREYFLGASVVHSCECTYLYCVIHK